MTCCPVLLKSIILSSVGKMPCTKCQRILQTGVIGVQEWWGYYGYEVCVGRERYGSVLNCADWVGFRKAHGRERAFQLGSVVFAKVLSGREQGTRRQFSWRSGFSWKVVGAENVVKSFLKCQSLQVLKMLSFALVIRKRNLGQTEGKLLIISFS